MISSFLITYIWKFGVQPYHIPLLKSYQIEQTLEEDILELKEESFGTVILTLTEKQKIYKI